MSKQSVRSLSNKRLIENTLKYKVEDAEDDLKCARRKIVEDSIPVPVKVFTILIIV